MLCFIFFECLYIVFKLNSLLSIDPDPNHTFQTEQLHKARQMGINYPFSGSKKVVVEERGSWNNQWNLLGALGCYVFTSDN